MIPHTKTARMLTEVIRSEAAAIEGVGRISAHHPAVINGRAPAFLGIELGAQCGAAVDGGQAPRLSGQPGAAVLHHSTGYLVRIREATFAQSDLPVDEDLRVIAELEGSAGSVAIYRIRVFAGDTEAVTATITIHHS